MSKLIREHVQRIMEPTTQIARAWLVRDEVLWPLDDALTHHPLPLSAFIGRAFWKVQGGIRYLDISMARAVSADRARGRQRMRLALERMMGRGLQLGTPPGRHTRGDRGGACGGTHFEKASRSHDRKGGRARREPGICIRHWAARTSSVSQWCSPVGSST